MNYRELAERLSVRGERLRQLRLKRKFSQAQLAAKAGICLMSVVNAEKGKNIQIEIEELILSKIYDDQNWIPYSIKKPDKGQRIIAIWSNGIESFEDYPCEKEGINIIFWK